MYEDIHPEAKIAEDVRIDSGCLIEKDVIIGEGTKISKGVIIKSGVRIGENNDIHPYAVIGDMPQDIKRPKKKGEIIIGNSNTIREFSTINLPIGEGTETKIGGNNYLMAYSHVGHNCKSRIIWKHQEDSCQH